MKTATASPQSAPAVVKTVTTRTIVQPDEATTPKEKVTPDFWTYFEALQPSDWERHLLYIYRREGETGPTPQLEKSSGFILLPTGERVYLGDREETEHAIIEKFGGGTYRLILKRGSERVCEGRVVGEGPRKNPPLAPAGNYSDGPTVTTMSESSATAAIARDAMHTIAGQERSAYEVATRALQASADVVQRMATAPATPAAPAKSDDELMFRQLMVRMMERMMAPPPDPMESLIKMFALMKELGLAGGGGGGMGIPTDGPLGRIFNAAFDRILNPSPSAPAQSASAELVRSLPAVAAHAAQAISEWRVGVEAQRDTAAIMRGQAARSAPTIIAPAAPGAPAAAAPPATNGGAQPMGAPTLEFVETRIMSILREPVSAAEAADKCLEFLDTLDPMYIANLKNLGESGLLALFQQRAILRPAVTNLPRLREFIQAFLQYIAENEAAEASAAAAQPPAPPAAPDPGSN